MYLISNLREGQRVTQFGSVHIGTVVQIMAMGTRFLGARVHWDGGKTTFLYMHELRALIPNNDDGYFDGPPGYVDAG